MLVLENKYAILKLVPFHWNSQYNMWALQVDIYLRKAHVVYM